MRLEYTQYIQSVGVNFLMDYTLVNYTDERLDGTGYKCIKFIGKWGGRQ